MKKNYMIQRLQENAGNFTIYFQLKEFSKEFYNKIYW